MRTLFSSLAVLSLSACVFSVEPNGGGSNGSGNGGSGPANPEITHADAGCYPDGAYRDFVWYFEADVDDRYGSEDIAIVYADVYDSWTGEWVDGFDLYRDGGITWYSAWVGDSTYLDCTYGGYEVDITGQSLDGSYDVVTVLPLTG